MVRGLKLLLFVGVLISLGMAVSGDESSPLRCYVCGYLTEGPEPPICGLKTCNISTVVQLAHDFNEKIWYPLAYRQKGYQAQTQKEQDDRHKANASTTRGRIPINDDNQGGYACGRYEGLSDEGQPMVLQYCAGLKHPREMKCHMTNKFVPLECLCNTDSCNEVQGWSDEDGGDSSGGSGMAMGNEDDESGGGGSDGAVTSDAHHPAPPVSAAVGVGGEEASGGSGEAESSEARKAGRSTPGKFSKRSNNGSKEKGAGEVNGSRNTLQTPTFHIPIAAILIGVCELWAKRL